MKNKKIIIIILLLIASIGGILFWYLYNKKYDVTFTLNGDENMIIDYGSSFVDPGFVAKNGFGKDISTNVTISGNVESFLVGEYKISYELSFGKVKKELYRTITVDVLDINKFNIVLNGEEEIYLLKNTKYYDEGAYVVNSINNEKIDFGNLNVTDNINFQEVGEYSINYTYTYKNQSIAKTRKVEVFDIKYSLTPTTITTKSVKVLLDLSDIENYSNTKLPDGKTSLNNNIEYEVTKNGIYSFVITLKNNDKYEKVIEVNNIIDNYTCKGTITSTGTKITVTPANDKVKKYEWVIKGNIKNGSSTYNEYKIIKDASVNLIFENGGKYQVKCNIEDKLVYHFTYDLKNTGKWTKPEIKCDSYTASQRTKLEKTLKQLVNEGGGKGSRGGTVAAVRFLIGGLDYRIRYQAPRGGDAVLGKYQREGLNIGNNQAWGCRVAGYINGFDCTHFIEWALAQTGFKAGAYSYPKTETSKVINKIKPGDLLYVRKKSGETTHVAIVAGIENDIYYVAESVPGKDGKLGVTLHATKRSTVLSAYKAVGKVPYTKEGVVTNMWLTE